MKGRRVRVPHRNFSGQKTSRLNCFKRLCCNDCGGKTLNSVSPIPERNKAKKQPFAQFGVQRAVLLVAEARLELTTFGL